MCRPRVPREQIPRNPLRVMCSVAPQGHHFPDVKVKSICLHHILRELPGKIMERDSGWVLLGVLSRASFRRQHLNDQKTFSVLSLHINKVYAKERGIGKKPILAVRTVMLEENEDLVADNFHGAARRRENSNNLSIIDPLLTALCRCLPAPHLCKDPDRFLAVGLTCDFLKPPESDR